MQSSPVMIEEDNIVNSSYNPIRDANEAQLPIVDDHDMQEVMDQLHYSELSTRSAA